MVGSSRKLRVLIADGVSERLREVTMTVTSLGHEVVGEGADLASVGRVTVATLPDVAHAGDREEMQSAIGIGLERFAEYHALEGAFGRRAVTERAKGILMERHSLDEQQAFHLLREHARRTNRKIADVAESVLASHRLL